MRRAEREIEACQGLGGEGGEVLVVIDDDEERNEGKVDVNRAEEGKVEGQGVVVGYAVWGWGKEVGLLSFF